MKLTMIVHESFTYSASDMREYADQCVRKALTEREFVHAASSRVYARLASAVRAGMSDALLVQMLRAEVAARVKGAGLDGIGDAGA